VEAGVAAEAGESSREDRKRPATIDCADAYVARRLGSGEERRGERSGDWALEVREEGGGRRLEVG
jgi:hypothetical protein